MADPTIIKKGERASVVGRSGVGKTTLSKWLMFRSPMRWIVLDTKYDDGFSQYQGVNKLPDMATIAKFIAENKLMIIRPRPSENKPKVLDNWLGDIHENFNDVGVSIDEGYQVALGSNAGPGLTGLITRGRIRGQSVIVGSQRPTKLPMFCFTEVNHFFIMQLSSLADKKRVAEYTGHPEMVRERIEPRYFAHYNVALGRLTRYSPVSFT